LALFGDFLMRIGTVISFDASEGSGVIAPDDGTRHVSIRISPRDDGRLSRMSVGQKVRYDNGRGVFGNAYARNIILIP
jgi:cold shock CspA family protein